MATILIVDDEALIRWSVCETLESAGYRVHEAGCAREALALADGRADVRVILLDLKLPDSSDLGLLRQLLQVAPASRIILMTAHGTPEILDQALKTGAFAVLTKPFDLQEMVSLVAAAAAA
ncbi:MAG TPA: response regulator [Vicinamibacterales bacterium]|nr:response regulator [Vicinamibacterales bacterium]